MADNMTGKIQKSDLHQVLWNDIEDLIVSKQGVISDAVIDEIVDGAPDTMDTLKKISDIITASEADLEQAMLDIGDLMVADEAMDDRVVDIETITGALVEASNTHTQDIIDLGNHKIEKGAGITVTLVAANWTGASAPYTYELNASSRVTATSEQVFLPPVNCTPEMLEQIQDANLQDGGQSADTIIIKAYGTKPTSNITLRLIQRGQTTI